MGKRHHTQSANFLGSFQIVLMPDLEPECSRAAKIALLLIILGASACARDPTGMQGQWFGTVKPISGTCDPASQAVLNIEQGRFPPYAAVFAPTGGVLMLQGSSDGVNQVTADLHTSGTNHQVYTVTFSGKKDGDSITGMYITQRCRSNVELHRK